MFAHFVQNFFFDGLPAQWRIFHCSKTIYKQFFRHFGFICLSGIFYIYETSCAWENQKSDLNDRFKFYKYCFIQILHQKNHSNVKFQKQQKIAGKSFEFQKNMRKILSKYLNPMKNKTGKFSYSTQKRKNHTKPGGIFFKNYINAAKR